MSDFATFRAVKARKEHKCLECHRTITRGETYHRSAGTYYGDFWHWTACAHCDALRIIVAKIDPEHAYDDDEGFNLREWVFEYGVCPAEVHHIARAELLPALSLYRWSRWFEDQWAAPSGGLREVPQYSQEENK